MRSRPLRYVPEGGAVVEITLRTIQGRYLLRPDRQGRVNEAVIGVLGRAQRLYRLSIIAVSVLSSHLHIIAFAEDADQLASFMRHANGNLSLEICRLHDWPGKLWERRYRPILVSDEEEAQVARLKYLLAAGVKEHLVDRAIEWPGVHSVRELLKDQPLRGWWFDRTQEYAARRRGERPGRYDYATEETLVLDPLPCWRHLPPEEIRRRVKELVRAPRDAPHPGAVAPGLVGQEVGGKVGDVGPPPPAARSFSSSRSWSERSREGWHFATRRPPSRRSSASWA